MPGAWKLGVSKSSGAGHVVKVKCKIVFRDLQKGAIQETPVY